jgi:hypothetical protein
MIFALPNRANISLSIDIKLVEKELSETLGEA